MAEASPETPRRETLFGVVPTRAGSRSRTVRPIGSRETGVKEIAISRTTERAARKNLAAETGALVATIPEAENTKTILHSVG